MIFRTKHNYVSPAVSGEVSLRLEDTLLVGSGPSANNTFVIEGQEIQDYFEETDLSNAWD